MLEVPLAAVLDATRLPSVSRWALSRWGRRRVWVMVVTAGRELGYTTLYLPWSLTTGRFRRRIHWGGAGCR